MFVILSALLCNRNSLPLQQVFFSFVEGIIEFNILCVVYVAFYVSLNKHTSYEFSACHHNCKSCNGPNHDQCTSCSNPAQVVFMGECLNNCLDNFFIRGSQCVGKCITQTDKARENTVKWKIFASSNFRGISR